MSEICIFPFNFFYINFMLEIPLVFYTKKEFWKLKRDEGRKEIYFYIKSTIANFEKLHLSVNFFHTYFF